LRDKPHVRERTQARFTHVLVDDVEDLTPAQRALLDQLGDALTVTSSEPVDLPTTITLDQSLRCRERILRATGGTVPTVAPGGDVRFWRCANERAQAQAVAADVARLLREGLAPERVAVLVRSVRNEGQTVAVALEERALDSTRPDLFVHRLIERLGLRQQQLFSAQADVVERLRNLSRLGEMASAYVRRSPQATPREFARYLSAVADAGLRDDEPAEGDAPRDGAAVMAMQAAPPREFDHVF